MGLRHVVKDQFLDVIEFEDISNKLIVYKFRRESGNNELKQGSKVIVRESQCAVFLKGGRLADILPPGTYSLKTENMPVLSTLQAFPYSFASPVIADLYFVSTRQFIDSKWAPKPGHEARQRFEHGAHPGLWKILLPNYRRCRLYAGNIRYKGHCDNL